MMTNYSLNDVINHIIIVLLVLSLSITFYRLIDSNRLSVSFGNISNTDTAAPNLTASSLTPFSSGGHTMRERKTHLHKLVLQHRSIIY